MRQQSEPSQATLLGAALFYARGMGWPVLPLSRLVSRPVDAHASDEVGTLTRWWTEERYNVGIPTGRFVDALEVSASVGADVNTDIGPVLALGDRYQFLIRPSTAISVHSALKALGPTASQLQLRHLGLGDLLVVPPSVLPGQSAHWVREPDLTRRELPDALSVLSALAQAANWQRGEVNVQVYRGVPEQVGRTRS
jgi:hypothetical protein